MDEPSSVVPWALEAVGADPSRAAALDAAIRRAGATPGADGTAWGMELHHDGSDRIDVSAFVHAPHGRRIQIGDLEITAGPVDVHELDVVGATDVLVGVFHGVDGAIVPPPLRPLGTPLVVGHLPGRGGIVRLVLAVQSPDDLPRLASAATRLGVDPAATAGLRQAAPFSITRTSLRITVDWLPDHGRLGSRIGIEALVDPALVDVQPTLAGLGVDRRSAERVQEIAARLPRARDRHRQLLGLATEVDAHLDAAGLVHIGVSWSGTEPATVKSYVMVTSHARAGDRRFELLRSAASRAAASWPDRVTWARGHLPLRDRGDDDALTDWSRALGGTAEWRTAATSTPLTERWERDGLDEDRARVAVSPLLAPGSDEQTWLPWFERVRAATQDRSRLDGASADTWLVARERDVPVPARTVPFAALWWPAVEAAWQHLAAEAGDSATTLDATVQRDLQVDLLSRLSEVTTPSLADELMVGLTYGQQFLRRMGDVPADPPRTRFAATCQRLASGGLDDVLLTHPVLPSLIGIAVRQWQEAVIELVDRVDRHRRDLEQSFAIPADSPLTGIALSVGDRHNDGRAVAVLAFGERRLVYKPRDVRLEHLWSQVVGEVTAQLPDGDPVRTARVLPADDGRPYGFAEFIAHRPAEPGDELRAFYRHAGITLAVLHALSATDCHYENLVASGDQLVLVDAEALFETRGSVRGPDDEHGSVLQVGMLPAWLWLEGDRTALDVSALGCTSSSIQRTAPTGWRAVNTDAMSRGPVDITPPHPSSLPTAPGTDARPDAHVDDVVDGFRSGYRAIMAARSRGLPALLAQAARMSRRLIVRPTYVYAVLLARSRDPESLRDPVARGMVLERLARLHLGTEDPAWPLLAAEQQALARLDVPLFEVDIRGGRTRWLGGSLRGWPDTDSLATVQRRIAGFDEEDLQWQERLIRSCFAARRARPSTADTDPVRPSEEPTLSRDSRGLRRDVADRIRRRIVDDARQCSGQVTWMTAAMLPDGEHVTVQPVGTGLYDGALGVAVALFSTGADDLARTAIAPLLAELDPDEPDRARRLLLGSGLGWNGAGGYLRALRHLERAGHLGAAEAQAAVDAVVAGVADDIVAGDGWLDVMSGAAGLLGPLAGEIAARPSRDPVRERCLHLLTLAADHLVQRQHPGGGWETLPASAPVTGLAHGASGIALALAEAGVVSGEERYIDAAARGVAYEATTFDPGAGNWPDFRRSGRHDFMLGWCAGAPGIALTRWRLLRLLPDHPDVACWQADLEAGATTTAQSPLLARDHLCCGNLGRPAILRALASGMDRDDWQVAAERIEAAVARRAGTGLPRSFLGDASDDLITVPGLMTGLGGAVVVLGGAEQRWLTGLLL